MSHCPYVLITLFLFVIRYIILPRLISTKTTQCIKPKNMGNIASNLITETVISLTGPIVGLISSASSLIVIKVYLQDLHVLMKNLYSTYLQAIA